MKKRKIMRLDTTPAELRRIADDLEKQWTESLVGREVPRVRMFAGSTEMNFVMDQQRADFDVKEGTLKPLGSALGLNITFKDK